MRTTLVAAKTWIEERSDIRFQSQLEDRDALVERINDVLSSEPTP